MTVTNLVFVTRKPSVSFAEFVKYSEEVHVPLTTRIAGDTMPKTFRRHYTDSSNPSYVGPNRGVDCILEMVWEDEAAVGRFLAKLGEGDNTKVLQDDWKHYIDDKGETVVGVSQTFSS
ncbi:hypothetical protein DFH06DRAFT_1324341 [Mycena polygramma]|nr:hypothetical protein DFH06DRAFT_1352621 [Mycena polygramma]KAJ7663824.1 hypothetical protein DFH06DRAFT_1324341 [Mycena polygramma]